MGGTAFMRLTDMMMAFPALILATGLAAIPRPSLWIATLVIAMVNWVWIARVISSQTLSIAQRDFSDAARALGVPTWRFFWKHLLPHLLPTLLVWGHAGDLDHGYVCGVAVVPGCRGATADAQLGRHDQRRASRTF